MLEGLERKLKVYGQKKNNDPNLKQVNVRRMSTSGNDPNLKQVNVRRMSNKY